ncbi:MAG: NrfD/PsrC family molybdoenzyme membrane anchor subunit, partial [Planctomycetota bacterium]
GATLQREWTARGEHGRRGILLEIAFLAGAVGPGLYLTSALCRFHFGLPAAFLIVLIGYGLPHLLFLGRVGRFWRGILKPQASWISRGFVFAGLFLAFGFLTSAHYCPVIGIAPLAPGSPLFEWLVLAGGVSALLLAIYPGFLFSVLRAIPFWHSVALIPLFVFQAFGGGLALTFLLGQLPGVSAPSVRPLVLADLAILATTAVLIAAHVYSRGVAGPAGRISAQMLLHGKYRRLFLGGAVVCGLALPLALLAAAAVGLGGAAILSAAAVFQLSGILLFKYCLLNAGAYSQLYTDGLLHAGS